ncbi:CBS domain-containing protein [bacterium]|nr:CBS domain-containing protein [FCB group bacterium]MBL7191464.1 CBS domain-containing protein [bacterium]
METKLVKDIMLPLKHYAVVDMDCTLKDALIALDKAQANLSGDRQPHRAVLVSDKKGSIIGKLGQLGFLKALEPKYNTLGDVDRLSRVGVSEEFIDSMIDNMRFWQDDFSSFCFRAQIIKIKNVMHSVEESIDINASLVEAIHRMIMWQSLSILVRDKGEVTGILRLSDLFSEAAAVIKGGECES